MDDLAHENVDDERLEKAKQRLMGLMGVWIATFNVMAGFAAPRVFAKVPADHEMTPERLTVLFEDYIEMITGNQWGGKFKGDEFHRTVAPTRIVQGLLAEWRNPDPLPASIVQAARDFFIAFGWPEPEGGWDNWDPPPE